MAKNFPSFQSNGFFPQKKKLLTKLDSTFIHKIGTRVLPNIRAIFREEISISQSEVIEIIIHLLEMLYHIII